MAVRFRAFLNAMAGPVGGVRGVVKISESSEEQISDPAGEPVMEKICGGSGVTMLWIRLRGPRGEGWGGGGGGHPKT